MAAAMLVETMVVTAAAFSGEAGGVLCLSCGAGEGCRLTARDVRYLQDVMRRGLDSLGDRDAIFPDALFAALRQMAEGKLEVPIRSGRLLV